MKHKKQSNPGKQGNARFRGVRPRKSARGEQGQSASKHQKGR